MNETGRQPLAEDLGFLLSRASGMALAAVNKALTPLGLKVRPYSVLALACETDEGMNQRQIAAAMGLDPSQLVALLDELEDRGLVSRTTDPNDRRNKLVVATEAGFRLRAEAQGYVDQAHTECFGPLPASVRNQMRKALQSMISQPED
ncbi:MarR family winged helix-turn-helix transcriptional regulator [Nocardia goodfellowii]|uniref:DNA-binding MarR family transcriptional regulator n=1 Tax=Nocardia goodfellowii TaxID=882446 RepID=A0ABS4QAN0_9NOCA|nr:MarR family transcriptional regulator [Nocardia goodfellowii]MBP2188751.1 DNA-binding MarR family transcriptional regulator [Nocardia goodfellowii]